MSNEELWQTVLAQVQLNISPANFATWFKNTEITSQKEGQVVFPLPILLLRSGWKINTVKIFLKFCIVWMKELKK